MAMGQALGTAVALAVQTGSSVQDVDHGVLVRELTAQGINRLGPEA